MHMVLTPAYRALALYCQNAAWEGNHHEVQSDIGCACAGLAALASEGSQTQANPPIDAVVARKINDAETLKLVLLKKPAAELAGGHFVSRANKITNLYENPPARLFP